VGVPLAIAAPASTSSGIARFGVGFFLLHLLMKNVGFLHFFSIHFSLSECTSSLNQLKNGLMND